jgi:uncharacterized protein
MPQALTYPGVYVEEVPSGVRTISGVATSIGLFIGWAIKGPVDKATRIFSFVDFEREYGGLHRESLLGYSVRQFFDNGGSDAYVIRIAKVSNPPEPGPQGNLAVVATTALGDISIKASSPGEWANDYLVRTTLRDPPAPAAEGLRFKLEVVRVDGTTETVAESYENVSLDRNSTRFVEAIVNARSRLIQISVAATPADPTDDEATLGDAAGVAGADGDLLDLDASATIDQLKELFDEGGVADKLDLFNIVCVPGMTAGAGVQAMQEKCATRRAFFVADCPPESTTSTVIDDLLASVGSAPSHAAFYFPWVKAADPLQQVGTRFFPPCGFVAGIMARTDASRGVWKAPAGTDAVLNGALEFRVKLSDAENGSLNPKGVNCLRTMPVYGNIVWGARTIDGDNDRGSEWKYVPVRRMALFLEESLFRGTQWVVFEPNDEPLWSQIRLNVGAFMQSLFRQGAFQGSTPREAYFVKCDRTTTTQDDINRGIVNIHVGFAPLKPAEFVVLRIQQIAGEIAT